jgi:hypothetical protein
VLGRMDRLAQAAGHEPGKLIPEPDYPK